MAGIDSFAKLVLHADGTDAGTTFTDSSSSGHTVTAVGNAQLDTAQQKFGTASGLLDGTGDWLTVPDSADWDFGTGDFTVDAWVRFPTAGGSVSNEVLVSRGNENFVIKISSDEIEVKLVSTTPITKATTIVVDTWYHIAVVRTGTDVMIFVDGTQIETTATSSVDVTYTDQLAIGVNDVAGTPAQPFGGWIDEFRWSKGIARWTTDFTPPTAAYSTTDIKTYNGLAVASVKTKNGLAIASVKTINGLA